MQGKTKEQKPKDKTEHTDQDSQGIAHHVGTIIKARLHIKRLTANRATLIHFHIVFQVIGIIISVHFPPSAPRTFILKQTKYKTRFGMSPCCTHNFQFSEINLIKLHPAWLLQIWAMATKVSEPELQGQWI